MGTSFRGEIGLCCNNIALAVAQRISVRPLRQQRRPANAPLSCARLLRGHIHDMTKGSATIPLHQMVDQVTPKHNLAGCSVPKRKQTTGGWRSIKPPPP